MQTIKNFAHALLRLQIPPEYILEHLNLKRFS